MPIASDFTINYGAKTVTHSAGTTVYTALAFFQYLAAEFANTSQMDDDYAFVSDTPTVFRWVNGWDMGDETSYQYLSGGGIETSDAQRLFANVYSIGSQYRSSFIYAIQNSAEITPWWGPGNIDIVLKVKNAGVLIDSGNLLVMSRDSDSLYDHNVVDLSGGGRNPVGVNTFADLNYNDTGDEYLSLTSVTGFNAGNYVAGQTSSATARINYVDTPNNRLYIVMTEGGPFVSETVEERTTRSGASTGTSSASTGPTAVVSAYNDIAFAFVDRDFTGGTVSGGPFVVGETVTQTGSGATFKFVGIVGTTLYMEDVAGTPNGTGLLTGGISSATYTPTGTAVQTAINKDLNNGAGVQPYNVVVDCATRSMKQVYQYLKYVCRHNSADTINGDTGEEYRAALGGYVDSKQAPFGTFAGGTMFGARGVWFEDYSAATFQLTDANAAQQLPPNYQKVTASHANLSTTKILVVEVTGSGGTIIKNQYTILSVTSNSITATTSFDINKTPQSGIARVGDVQYTYTSYAGAVLSGVSPDPTGETGAFYIPLLDVTADAATEQSDNIIYGSPFWCRTIVRKYGYKPYTQDVQFGSTGISFSPILTDDPQAV